MSKASEDFPEPEIPVKTTNLFLGISTLMFFKLWTRAPLIEILSAILLWKAKENFITHCNKASIAKTQFELDK